LTRSCSDSIQFPELNLSGAKLIDANLNSKLYKVDLSTIFFQNKNLFEKCLYDKNRPIDQNRVEHITDLFKNEKGHFLNGICVIGYIKNKNPKILDGQHRICVAQSLSQCYGYLNLISFQDSIQMWDYYVKINQSTPLPDYYKSSENFIKNCIDKVSKSVFKKYPKIFSTSRSCHKPNLNIDNLKECLFKIYNDPDNITLKTNIEITNVEQSVAQILNDIYAFNDYLKSKSCDYFVKCSNNAKAIPEAYKKVPEKGDLYFGLLFNGSADNTFHTKYLVFINNKYK
jgi:hypothetical protein